MDVKLLSAPGTNLVSRPHFCMVSRPKKRTLTRIQDLVAAGRQRKTILRELSELKS